MNFILTFHIISFHHRRWGRDGEYVSTFQWQSKRNGSANLRKKPGDAGDLFRIYCKHPEQHESSRNIRKFCHPTLYRLLWRNIFTTWNISLKTYVWYYTSIICKKNRWQNEWIIKKHPLELSSHPILNIYLQIFPLKQTGADSSCPFSSFPFRLWPLFVQMRLCRRREDEGRHNLGTTVVFHHTVDGSEIRLPYQLRLVAYPIIYKALLDHNENHQTKLDHTPMKSK